MDDAQIRDWLAAGHEIGAHTLTHPAPDRPAARTGCSAEIFDGKRSLEDRFGIPIRHFCYPYGDHDEAVRDLVAEAGYASAPTVEFGCNMRRHAAARSCAGSSPATRPRGCVRWRARCPRRFLA